MLFWSHAAAGGVGLILCQWAKSLGATVIGVVGNEEKGRAREEAWVQVRAHSGAGRDSRRREEADEGCWGGGCL